jgi:hypothetical protein
MAGFLAALRELWRAFASDPHVVEPSAVDVDAWRTEFHWRGPPLTVDRRRKAVLRGGRVLARCADIRSIDVQHVRADEDRPEHWRVSLGVGFFSGATIGTTRDDVEASIAAARLSTVLAVKVRAL